MLANSIVQSMYYSITNILFTKRSTGIINIEIKVFRTCFFLFLLLFQKTNARSYQSITVFPYTSIIFNFNIIFNYICIVKS
jgi:hypothetical protein